MKEKAKAKVLLVEDSITDAKLVELAARKARWIGQLRVVKDGVDAYRFLTQAEGFEDAWRPDLILLDLNMPRMGGFGLLEKLQDHPPLRRIPVVVLTTSSAPEDVRKAYALHANCFVSKPPDFQTFAQTLLDIEEFWFKVCLTPGE